MYLLEGISTLAAPALPRAPLRACVPARVRLCAPLRACVRPVRLCARSFSAPCGIFGPLLYRCGFTTSWLCASVGFLRASVGFRFASGACLFCFYTLLCLFSFVLLLPSALLYLYWVRSWVRFCMALLAFLLRKALALSFMHTSAFCIIFILSNAYAPKTFLYKSCI